MRFFRDNSRVLRSAGLAIAALAIGATLAACSSGSSKADSTTTSLGNHADTALANSELAPASAYPAGWQSQGAGSGETQASLFASLTAAQSSKFAKCLGVAPSLVDSKPVEAAGPTYANSTTDSSISDSVEVFPEADQAQMEAQALASSTATSCLTSNGNLQLEGGGLSDISITPLSVPTVGQHTGAVVIHATVTSGSQSVAVVVANVIIQSGRSEAVVQYAGPEPGVSQSIINAMDSAAAAALTTK